MGRKKQNQRPRLSWPPTPTAPPTPSQLNLAFDDMEVHTPLTEEEVKQCGEMIDVLKNLCNVETVADLRKFVQDHKDLQRETEEATRRVHKLKAKIAKKGKRTIELCDLIASEAHAGIILESKVKAIQQELGHIPKEVDLKVEDAKRQQELVEMIQKLEMVKIQVAETMQVPPE